MPIETVATIGKGAVGLLHGSKIAKAVGSKHLEYVMDDERYLRHRTDRIVINGEDQTFITIPASQAKPVDLVVLAVKATGLDQAINSMEGLVGPETRIISLLNGVTSEEAIAAPMAGNIWSSPSRRAWTPFLSTMLSRSPTRARFA